MYLEIFLMIFGIAILLLVAFCIPILLQIGRTAKDLTVTLETLNQSLPAILKNLEDITTNINSSTSAVNREVQNFTHTVDRFNLVISDIVDDVQHIAPLAMKLPIMQKIKNVVAIVKGIRVFVDVFLAKE
jgi:uncharacterized protein YoxC